MEVSKRLTRVFLSIAIITLMIALITGCSAKKESTETTQTTSQETSTVTTLKAGELQVGSDIAFPPFENMEGETPVGFDVDLMGAIAEKLGLKAKFINSRFDGLIPSLNSKKFDAIMSAMTITDDRKKEVLFSDPYIDSNQSLATMKDSDIKDTVDLKDKIVGVQSGTTGEAWTKENVTDAKEIKSYDTALDAFTALQAGQITAVINDLPVSAYIVKDKPELALVKEIKTDEQYGIAMRQADTELADAINTALKELKDDGTYDKIYDKWFGTSK